MAGGSSPMAGSAPPDTGGSEPGASRAAGRVSWRRFAAAVLPAMAAAAVLIYLTASGTAAASFAVSGQEFTVSASSLAGAGFEQYGGQYQQENGARHTVELSVIRQATVRNLCQSVTVFGHTLRITAGTGSQPVSASNLVIATTDLSGDVTFKGVSIGQDASTLDQVPGQAGQIGEFGEQALSVNITNAHLLAWSTTAGTFTMPGFHLHIGGGAC